MLEELAILQVRFYKSYELADNASVLIACRVSPMQKAQIVSMVRQKNKKCVSLAIGDGANDVNMITSAHIGIGISGLEGQAAARAADYAIGQFKFLKTLLFFHGRECYRRNSYTVGYMFYKNVLLVFPIFFYGIFSLYSGQPIYESYLYQTFNLFYTSWPILYFGLFDYEHSREDFLRKPVLYKVGIQNKHFSSFVFWRWVVYGIWQGYLLMYICFTSLNRNCRLKRKLRKFRHRRNICVPDGSFGGKCKDFDEHSSLHFLGFLFLDRLNCFGSLGLVPAQPLTVKPNLLEHSLTFGNSIHSTLGTFFIASGIIMVDIGLNWAQRAINRIIQ